MRLEVTRRAELAVRAVAALASSGQRLKAGDVADALATTTGFVAQVLNPLVKAGWVRSDPGPTGGYTLTRNGHDVSVLQVIEAVDGPTDDGRCVVLDRPCTPSDRCVLHGAWQQARDKLLGTLAGTKSVDWQACGRQV